MGVCIWGVCLRGGGGSGSRGVCIEGGWADPHPTELGKRAVILLECFLVKWFLSQQMMVFIASSSRTSKGINVFIDPVCQSMFVDTMLNIEGRFTCEQA